MKTCFFVHRGQGAGLSGENRWIIDCGWENPVPTRAGPVCPPMVGITNSPKMGENRMMFPPGGHMGPPLRQMSSMGGNGLTHFVL